MPTILYCRACLEGLRYQGGEYPRLCPRCGKVEPDWLTSEQLPPPKTEYILTLNDKRFLRAIRIQPEEIDS